MRQSQLFAKVLREAPRDATSVNAQWLERGGFTHKNSAGVYSYLPLGFRVIRKISDIIREEMNAAGAEEMLMPALIEKKYLDATGRWDVPIGYRVKGVGEKEELFALGWTHEEVLTNIVSRYVSSYKDLPFAAYQIQTKFRNEPRAKSGVLRGKEFIMKDLYSFHATQEDFEAYYARMKEAYQNVFKRCGLEAIYTRAGGGAFTESVTHEFQVVSPVGEDTIFICSGCGYAENAEMSALKGGGECLHCKGTMEQKTAIEVGNIFPLGTKYAKALNLFFTNEKGERLPVVMGSYGIGVSRLMGTIVETYHDEKGIIWPESVAPFTVHLLELGKASARKLYENLQKRNIAVLYDDRQASSGDKLAVADVLGMPWRAVVSEKTGEKIELKKRNKASARMAAEEELYVL